MEYKKDYFGYVYKWVDSVNGKFYIGSHHGDINDTYIGSGVLFRRAYNKRPEAFTMEVIEYVTSECTVGNHRQCSINSCPVLQAEQKHLDVNNVALNEECYNLKPHASGGGCGHNKGRTKDNDSGMARSAEAKIGKTRENSKSVKYKSDTLRSKNKSNDAGIQARAEARSGETKETSESRKVASDKIKGSRGHSWSGYCYTPQGKFESLSEAAKFYKMSIQGIQYRCNTSTFPDWYVIKPEIFMCQTPLGKFKTLKEARIAHDLSTSGVINRLKANTFPDWKYLK